MKQTILLLLSLLFPASSFLACQSGPPDDRSHPVGRTTRDWVDPLRPQWLNPNPRPLRTTIWYPAEKGAKEEESVLGPPGLPLIRLGWVATDAKPQTSNAEFPLVVLSHGTGSSGSHLSWFAEGLAANGYVVAAVTHHGNSIADDDLAPQGFYLWWERALDLTQVVDRLEADPEFGPSIDFGRVGAAGFSLGGHSVLLLGGARVDLDGFRAWCDGPEAAPSSCSPPPEALGRVDQEIDWAEPKTADSLSRSGDDYRDERVRAIYSMAPAVANALTPTSLGAMTIPTRVVVGSEDEMAPAHLNADHVIRNARTVSDLRLEGVGHYAFLSRCGWAGRLLLSEICAEAASTPRSDIHQQIRLDSLRFFEATMAGTPR